MQKNECNRSLKLRTANGMIFETGLIISRSPPAQAIWYATRIFGESHALTGVLASFLQDSSSALRSSTNGYGLRRARYWRQATAAKFKSLRQPAAPSLATPNAGNASVSGSHDHVVLTLLLDYHLELHHLVRPTIGNYHWESDFLT